MKKSYIKNPEEIEIIAEGGQILHQILRKTAALVKPGVSTFELNQYAEKEIEKSGGRPAFKNYGPKNNPFPAGLCTSLNEVIVHGVPAKEAILKEGDIVGLDIGMEYKGFFTDTAITVGVGKVSSPAQKLMNTTKKALALAIEKAKDGGRMGDIGFIIQKTAEDAGFSVVRDLVGHGVGYEVHEEPSVPCYGKPGQGIELKENMVLAIEPMLCEKNWKIAIEDDGWTITTLDRGLSAHFEHTIAVGKKGGRILT